MKNDYTSYAKAFNAPDKVLTWISSNLKNYLKKNEENQTEIEHIIDYLILEGETKNLVLMSYDEAKRNTDAWTKKQMKKGEHIKETVSDTKVILDFKDGFKIVQLIGKKAYEREGYLMSNCVASYYGSGKEIYSLRDKDNMSHCTMEKDQQVKGKGNGEIHPKYIDYVIAFLEKVGMKVRDSEMAHLGYEVVQFAEYCTTPIYRNRYVRKGQKVAYSDKVIIFTDFFTASHYKGNKICLFRGDVKIKENQKKDFGKIQAVGGYLSIYSSATLPDLKTVGGDLSINSSATLKADNLKTVGGDLSINSSATLKADNLKTVGGYLSIYSSATLKADNLKTVGGYLSIYSSATLKADNLKTVGGYLSINSSATLPDLKTVGGYLSINSSATLPDLKTVGGDLYINSSATLKADNLKTVGGYLSIYSSATLPDLKTVGGDLSIYSSATLKADNLKTVGGYLSIYSSATLPDLKTVGGDLSINSSATLPDLKTVGGDLSIYSSATLNGLKLEEKIRQKINIKGRFIKRS